jgi:hypothetical protein
MSIVCYTRLCVTCCVVVPLAADAMSAAAQLCQTLSARLKQQQQQQQQKQQPAERWQQPRQQHHSNQPGDQQQQQQQQRGQLPLDQQVELDNSLNSLALSALHMWLLLFGALAAAPHGTGKASSSAAAGAGVAPAAALVELGCQYEQVAGYAVQALKFWPAPQAYAATDGSTSSNRSVVRYGDVVLPYLPVVDVTRLLPAALALAQSLSIALDAVQQYASMPIDQLVQLQGQGAKVFSNMVQLSRIALADPSVLELQLLLLACQAKLRHQQLAATQQGLSCVHGLSKDSWWQQEQQEQAIEQQQQQRRPRRLLKLPAYHDLLLPMYALSKVDLAQQLQQQQQQQRMAGPPHIRYGTTRLT